MAIKKHFFALWIIVILFKKYYKDKLTEDGEVSGDAAVAALTDIDTKINAYRLIEVSLAQKVKLGQVWENHGEREIPVRDRRIRFRRIFWKGK